MRQSEFGYFDERIVKNSNGNANALLTAAGLFAVAAPLVIGLLDGGTLRAQTVSPTLRFEVASVKPAVPSPPPGIPTLGIPGPNNKDPGRFSGQLNLLSLILTAYEIPLYRMANTDERFTVLVDVEAKMPVDTTREQFNVMLQNLLADRFGLKVHWMSKDINMYTLVVAKGGPKVKAAAPDSPRSSENAPGPSRVGPDGFPIPPPGNGYWMGAAPGGSKIGLRRHNETAAEMAHTIGLNLDGPVTDATGLTGRYDYTIFWSSLATVAALGFDPGADPDGPSIFDAVEQQLGLKIEKRKAPVQMLVVDHVDKKPTEN